MNILNEANSIIHGARNEAYGHPAKNHGLTAKYWSIYLDIDVNAEDVCILNILQKISRWQNKVGGRDHLVDIAGYAGNIEMIQEYGHKRKHTKTTRKS